ncbi:MAG: hypothetical protein KDH17_09770 [Rhodocyclaceae bacterium]|nr:hypothetical protein [Rhodocyclaceae bacterium]
MKRLLALIPLVCAASLPAGEADVLSAEAHCDDDRNCRFDVTVRHADEGWSHYADRWDVLGPDGQLLGRRTLLHPHVSEQPFTRSLGGVRIPAGLESVRIRAHDKVHGDGGNEVVVDIR